MPATQCALTNHNPHVRFTTFQLVCHLLDHRWVLLPSPHANELLNLANTRQGNFTVTVGKFTVTIGDYQENTEHERQEEMCYGVTCWRYCR